MKRYKKYNQTIVVACLLVSLVLVGCSRLDTPTNIESNIPTPAEKTATPAAEPTQATVEQIKFKQEDGSEKYALKLKPDGAKLVDGADRELARLTLDENQKVKIKDAGDQVLGYVVAKDGYWKLENPEQTKELYLLRRQEDGDFKLEDGTTDSLIYRIKVRDYGYEIESPDQTSLYKVKVKDGKISLRNARDETVISTKSSMAPLAMTCFGFDVLTPPQQAALAYAVNQTGGQ